MKLGYVAGRLAAAVPVLILVAVIVFLMLHLVPGDPASHIAGNFATPDEVERIRARLGLDRPLVVQFAEWIGGMLRGDLGSSVFYNVPVAKLLGQRLEPTVSLAALSLLLAITLALPIGIVAAWYAGRLPDRLAMLFSVVGFSVPIFVIGYVLIYVFSVNLKWFPVQGYRSLSGGVLPWLHGIALPSLGLGIVFSALIARVARAALIEVLAEDYILTAHAKGLSVLTIVLGHALRNAAVPIVTVIGTSFVLLIGGVVVTESVFNIPGLGRLVVDAILQRDFPVIQALLVVFAGVYVLINLVVDLIYVLIDPRIQY